MPSILIREGRLKFKLDGISFIECHTSFFKDETKYELNDFVHYDTSQAFTSNASKEQRKPIGRVINIFIDNKVQIFSE